MKNVNSSLLLTFISSSFLLTDQNCLFFWMDITNSSRMVLRATMKSSGLFFLLSLLSLLALQASCTITASGDECTPETCISTVSVYNTYTTSDCTGSFKTYVNANYTAPCDYQEDFRYSTYTTCSKSDGLQIVHLNDTVGTCASTNSSLITIHNKFRIGSCVRNSDGSTSSALWCNQAEADSLTPTALGLVDTTVLSPESNPCDLSTNPECADTYGKAELFGGNSCSGTPQAIVPAATAAEFPAIKLGKCYREGSISNLKIECTKDNLIAMRYFGGGCDGTPDLAYTFPRGKCAVYGPDSSVRITCKQTNDSSRIFFVAPLLVLFAIFSVLLQ